MLAFDYRACLRARRRLLQTRRRRRHPKSPKRRLVAAAAFDPLQRKTPPKPPPRPKTPPRPPQMPARTTPPRPPAPAPFGTLLAAKPQPAGDLLDSSPAATCWRQRRRRRRPLGSDLLRHDSALVPLPPRRRPRRAPTARDLLAPPRRRPTRSRTLRESAPERGGTFKIDVMAAAFGSCVCGRPKGDHIGAELRCPPVKEDPFSGL